MGPEEEVMKVVQMEKLLGISSEVLESRMSHLQYTRDVPISVGAHFLDASGKDRVL